MTHTLTPEALAAFWTVLFVVLPPLAYRLGVQQGRTTTPKEQ